MVYHERMVVETITEITHQKTLLFGAHGMLGHALQEVFPHAQCVGHHNVDITDEDAIMKLIIQERPPLLSMQQHTPMLMDVRITACMHLP